MGRKTFTAEQIIFKLREVEVLVGQGASISEFDSIMKFSVYAVSRGLIVPDNDN